MSARARRYRMSTEVLAVIVVAASLLQAYALHWAIAHPGGPSMQRDAVLLVIGVVWAVAFTPLVQRALDGLRRRLNGRAARRHPINVREPRAGQWRPARGRPCPRIHNLGEETVP